MPALMGIDPWELIEMMKARGWEVVKARNGRAIVEQPGRTAPSMIPTYCKLTPSQTSFLLEGAGYSRAEADEIVEQLLSI